MNTLHAFFHSLLLCFIPLFVALDAIGTLPMLLGLTESLSAEARRKVIPRSVLTAGAVGVGFLFLGKLIFQVIGVTVNDFRIAGGIILLVLSILDLVSPEKGRRDPGTDVGVFPIGTPLIAGPAVLATLLTMSDLFNPWITLLAFMINLGLVYFLFIHAGQVMRFLGSGGVKATAKLASLLLAAYAVMLIRNGLELFLGAV